MSSTQSTTPRRLPAVTRALQATAGAVSLVGGLTWLLLNLHGPRFGVDLFVGTVFAVGGLVLLMPHRIRLPGWWSALAATGAAVTGTAAGLIAMSSSVCCRFAYATARGFPFRWLQRGAIADDPQTARRLAHAENWQVDPVALAADLLFWGLLGLVVVAAVVAVRRAVRDRARAHP